MMGVMIHCDLVYEPLYLFVTMTLMLTENNNRYELIYVLKC